MRPCGAAAAGCSTSWTTPVRVRNARPSAVALVICGVSGGRPQSRCTLQRPAPVLLQCTRHVSAAPALPGRRPRLPRPAAAAGDAQPQPSAGDGSDLRAAAEGQGLHISSEQQQTSSSAPAAGSHRQQAQQGAAYDQGQSDSADPRQPTPLAALWAFLQAVFRRISAALAGIPAFERHRRLKKRKNEWSLDRGDGFKQAAYLEELGKDDPEAVLQHVDELESGAPDPVMAQYISALVKSGRIEEYASGDAARVAGREGASMSQLMADLQRKASGAEATTSFAAGGTLSQPLHVVLQPAAPEKKASFLAQLVNTLIVFCGSLLIGSMLWIVGSAVIRRQGAVGANSGLAGIAASGGSGSAAGAGAYAPKEYKKEEVPEASQKTFADVKGCPEAKEELEEVVEFLKSPERFTKLGGKLPKGVLLTGPPGTGKTLLARAVAGEAGVPFFYRAGSEFEEMFVGVGSRRVRTLFAAAKKKAPCIVFIDEIDAIGGSRKAWESQTRKTLNQLLVELDGFEVNEGVIVIAATNIPESLDPALTRPGRFDRNVAVPLPDVRGRAEILELYLSNKPVAPDVDMLRLARATPGFSGAQLANMVNEAALSAAKGHSPHIDLAGLEAAQDKILMGAERRSMVQTAQCRRNTAYHEAGHALLALKTDGAQPIRKATIMPRGHALGMVSYLPEIDKYDQTKQEMFANIDVAMGGKAAEELIFGADKVTTGVTSDLRQATRYARHMVAECGMSDELGPIYAESGGNPQEHRMSADTERKIDAEVLRIVKEAYQRACTCLREHETELHRLAGALLDYETLTSAEIRQVLDGSFSKPIPTARAILDAGGNPAAAHVVDGISADAEVPAAASASA